MSSIAGTGHQAEQQETASRVASESEQNNNNNEPQVVTRAAADKKTPTMDKQPGGGGLMRKRSSVQSNLSRHSNGGGHSLSSSTTNTSNEDIDQQAATTPPRMSNAEYEHVRNTTLLFFLDRLYLASQEGKEARTLHDLSCLFGTREFTKEMRQIVGASRNGLKKFLQSYPSLFQIEGDKVHLTQLKQDTQLAQRDYNREAVEYFKAKLLQFGTSLVPIKNLFGYRSQASQEVRHVSGKNTRDFKQFLALNEDVFEILADEHVVLKTALAELESQGQTSMSLQQSLAPLPADDAIVMDPYLNKQFAHLVEECMRDKMIAPASGEPNTRTEDPHVRVTLEQLYEQIQKQCQNELFLKMVKTLDDLRVFLRMHPKLFKRSRCESTSREFVSLLSESERRELEAATYPAHALQRQHSTLTSTGGPASLVVASKAQVARQQDSQQQMAEQQAAPFSSLPPPPPQRAHQQQTHGSGTVTTRGQDSPATKKQVVATPIAGAPKKPEDERKSTTRQKAQDQLPREPTNSQGRQPLGRQQSGPSGVSSHQHGHQLRANAPPFVPPSREPRHNSQQQQYASLNSNSPLTRQNSALTSGQYRQPVQAGARYQNAAVVQRSHSNLNQTATTRYNNHNHHQDTLPRYEPTSGQRRPPLIQDLPPIDHRSAIRNYLLKDNNSNSATTTNHSQHMSWTSPAQGGGGARLAAQQGQQVVAAPAPAPPPSADEMRARTVDMVREASNIITKIMTTTDAVAFDCKGYNLGFDGQITLIQFGYLPSARQVDPMHLANAMHHHHQHHQRQDQCDKMPPKPEVCVFDLITNPELAYCLKPLLESDKIVKIVHDVRNKSNALYVQFKIILNNVFDTQVANLVIQQQDTGKPAYKSRYISMSKLCEIYGDDELMRYRNLIKLKTSRAAQTTTLSGQNSLSLTSSSASAKDVNYWRARPLTKPMIFEATMDVYCLVGGIYQNLKSKLKPEYEPLFDQLNLEGVLARIRPDEIRSAKKERKIDLEVIDLKRKLYSETLGPVVLSNREIRLLRHIDLTDEVRAKIQQCKKVAKKLERLDMKAAMLLEAKQLDGAQLSSLSSNGTGDNGDSLAHTNARLSRQASSNQSSHEALVDDKSLEAGERQLKSITSKLDELNATGMLMDSSIFDELKDKMIESSSLLESLEDDDDDDHCEQATRGPISLSGGPHSHHHGSTGGDCCHCQCHHTSGSSSNHSSHTSTDLTTKTAADNTPAEQRKELVATTTQEAKQDSDQKLQGDIEESVVQLPASPKEVDSPQHKEEPTTTTSDHSIASNDSKSSTGCDMAVQCDLLS